MARYGTNLKTCLITCMALLCALALLPTGFAVAKTVDAAAAAAAPGSQKVVRVGLFEDTYHKVNEQGELGGYGYEYLQKIAGYEGWTIEYVEADWYTCFEKLKSGEIDILNGISYTQDRAQDMLFSTLPMAEERYYIYVDGRDPGISADDLGAVANKNMGVMVGAIPEQVLDSWEADNGLSTNHVNITTAQDVLDNLDARTMDCFVSVEEDWDQDWISPLIYIGSSDVYFAINEDRADLKKGLDSAMARIASDNPFYNDQLYEKYFSTSAAAILADDERS